jgi:hypothetical protein
LRFCSLCRAIFPKQKRSTAATWQGRSFESPRIGSVHRGWKSIPVCKPGSFLLRSRTLCSNHRRRSRKLSVARRLRHPQRLSRSSARRGSQSGPTAREWLPIHKDSSPSVQLGGRSKYSAFGKVTPLPQWHETGGPYLRVARPRASLLRGAPRFAYGGPWRAFARNHARRSSLEYPGLRGEGSTPVSLPPPATRAPRLLLQSISRKSPNKVRLFESCSCTGDCRVVAFSA